jgi:putative SOS response-associated peptidase YedK
MCGRYTLVKPETAADRFGFVDFHETRIVPRFNIAPSQLVLTVMEQEARRVGQAMRWGFQPKWMSDPKIPPPINAKTETLMEKALWRGALARARCLIVADGFYEWRVVPGQKTRQPMYIRMKDGGMFAFAGLYAHDAHGALTCAIVTTEPNDLMAPIHARMPAILNPEHEELWLDPGITDPLAARACLHPYAAASMEAYPVSSLVNAPRHEGPALIERLSVV